MNPLPATPIITITNNVRPSTIGTISVTGCGSGTLEGLSTNAVELMESIATTYTTSAFTVYAVVLKMDV
ncbi:MAG: hypothetical protein IPO48_11640 [Saprospiraceae bacterium]|nr:hypothetical protein [Saprospiraceae bacterium]